MQCGRLRVISGDSGAGYLNPTLLLPDAKTGRRGESNVTKSGAGAWIKWNTAWYKQFDLSYTGFLINGAAGPLNNASIAMYHSFSPDGVVVTTGHDVPGMTKYQGEAWCDAEGTPVMHHIIDMPSNLTLCAEQVAGMVAADRKIARLQHPFEPDHQPPMFYILRNILWKASHMVDAAAAISAAVEGGIEFVDPYTLGLLVKCHTRTVDCSRSGAAE